MRKKKSTVLVNSDMPTEPSPALDLDPTTNYQLHLDLWERLQDRLKNATSDSGATTSETDHSLSEDLSDERKFGKDTRRLLNLVLRAILNPVYIPWDVEEYDIKHVKGGRDKKRTKFPNPAFGAFSTPLTVVDSKGRIVLWYLPGLLSAEQKSSICSTTVGIAPLLRASVKDEVPEKTRPNWRVNQVNFLEAGRQICEQGTVVFSPGWFSQGHTSEDDVLKPSLNLRSHPVLGDKWIKDTYDVEKFLNLTLSLIHPDLFKSGLLMIRKLRSLGETMAIAREWQSVYSGIAIVSNRTTPTHRDSLGRSQWYDLLANYCDEDEAAGLTPRMLIKDLGLDLRYSSGTVIGFCGSVLEHEVESWGAGDRVCQARFMRKAVQERLEVPPAGWVEQNIYFQYLSKNM